jgi:REP element-mobilizing transposase RayT
LPEPRRGATSNACVHVHIVFSTKGRLPTIRKEICERLYAYIGGIIRNQKGALIAAGGTSDHIHLLVQLGKQVSIADLLRDIKANSSRWIHEEFSLDFAWQTGFGIFGVSFSDLDRVKGYIGRQEEHHRRLSYQDEFLELLKRHQIEFDERYLWD